MASGIAPEQWRKLAIGLVAAIVVYAIPFTRFVFSALVTLFHELGHAVMGWLMGHPSLPAFDFVYGGGFTHMGQFRLSVAVAIGLAFVWLLWLFRENRRSMGIVAALLLVWLLFVTREWRRELAIAAAGHLAEFILAGVFLYRSLAGSDGAAGAFASLFVQIHSMLFAWRLTGDEAFLAQYREGKGGALMNDLEVVALDLQIYLGMQPGIEGVAKMLLLFSLLPAVVAFIAHHQRERVERVLRSLRTAEA